MTLSEDQVILTTVVEQLRAERKALRKAIGPPQRPKQPQRTAKARRRDVRAARRHNR